jgi:hypothetical protein
MKKSLPTLVTLLAGAVGAYAQGQIEFDDYAPHVPGDGFEITVWAPQAANPIGEVYGNSPGDVPAGTQTYTGVALGGGDVGSGPNGYGNGNDYSIALYYGVGANATSLTQVPGAIATFDTSGGANPYNGYPGSWDAGGGVFVTVPGVAAGSTGTFQLYAWYNGGGTLSFAQASVPGSGDPYGLSQAANITLNGPPNIPSTLYPITSFSLAGGMIIPEPSTIALGVIGASTLLMRLRLKQ